MSSQEEKSYIENRRLAIFLSFISSFVDAVCYLGLFRTFTAFITGTFIILGTELAKPDGEAVTKAIVAVAFVAGLIGWTFFIRKLSVTPLGILTILLGVETAFLALFMLLAVILSPLESADQTATAIIAVAAVSAMSLQNAMMVSVLRAHLSTTAMTGNLTRLIFNLTNKIVDPAPGTVTDCAETPTNWAQIRHHIVVICAFAVGAAAGGVCFVQLDFWSLAIPIFILLFMLRASLKDWRQFRQ